MTAHAASVSAAPPEPPVSPTARCSSCARLGIVGLLVRGDTPRTVLGRFCFRCGPTGRRAVNARWSADSAAAAAALSERTHEEARRTPREPGGQRYLSFSYVARDLSTYGSWRSDVADLLDRLGLLSARVAHDDDAPPA